MTRRKRLERILDAALAPVREDVAELAGEVRVYHHDAVVVGTTKVADAEQRVTAATEQAAETVRNAEARHAAAMDGIRAELAEARGNTIRGALADLHRERETIARSYRKATVERDEARGQVAHLTAEVERLGAAWRARGEQLVAVEAQAAEAEQRAEVLEIELDEARRQHDEQRRKANDEWMAAERLSVINVALVDDRNALAAAARAVLPDLAHGLPSQPKGGSRTRAKARMEALAALVTPTETTTNQEATA